jgi:hypothetical protein
MKGQTNVLSCIVSSLVVMGVTANVLTSSSTTSSWWGSTTEKPSRMRRFATFCLGFGAFIMIARVLFPARVAAFRERLGFAQAKAAHATKKLAKNAKGKREKISNSDAMEEVTAKIDDLKAMLEDLYKQGADKVSDMMGSSSESESHGKSKGRKNKSSSGDSKIEAAKSKISDMYQQGAEKVSAMVGDHPTEKAKDLYHQGAAKVYDMMGDKENKTNHENQVKTHAVDVEGKNRDKSSASKDKHASGSDDWQTVAKKAGKGHDDFSAGDKENVKRQNKDYLAQH